MILELIRIHQDAVIPQYRTEGSSGFDFHCLEDFELQPGEIKIVPTGLVVANMQDGYEIQVRPRSGLATKGITVVNSPGTIDSDYRGEIKIILINLSKTCYRFNKHDRIAQGVMSKVLKTTIEVADRIIPTERGDGGFGSTGK